MSPSKISDETILRAMRERAMEFGGAISMSTWTTRGFKPSVETIKLRFGTWNLAWKRAGVEPNRSVRLRVTKEVALRALVENGTANGGWMTMREWGDRGLLPSAVVILNLFGGWVEAWNEAGFEVPYRWRATRFHRRWTKDEVIEAMRAQYRGEPISLSRWIGQGLVPNRRTIERLFGTFNAGVLAAGLPLYERPEITRDTVVDAVRDYGREFGHLPTGIEWDAWDGRVCSHSLIAALFGWKPILDEAANGAEFLKRAPNALAMKIADYLRRNPEVSGRLTAREREIFEGLMAGKTYQEIGNPLGITRERVRQIGNRIMRGGTGRRGRPSRKAS